MAVVERIESRRAQVLVVDIQEKLLPHIHDHAGVVRQSHRLISAARVLNLPITVSEQYVAGLGSTCSELGQCLERAPRLEKAAFSAWADEKIRARLTESLRATVLIVGIETHVCVLQTALDLLEEQMRPVVVADAVGSRRPTDHAVALDRLRSAGVLVSTVESVVFEMLGVSGTSEFKQILPLVKEL